MRAETAHPAVVARCRARADWLTSAKRVKRALSCGAGGAEAARAKRAVAHGFVSLLSETAAWSMAVLHVTAAEAHAEAVRAQVRKIDEAVIAPIDLFAAAIDDVRRAGDAQNAAAARYREIQDRVASKVSG